MAGDQDDEEDYLSMSFAEPAEAPIKETSLQRTARLKREAAERGRVLSKAELAEREKAAREKALATQLDGQNKGAKLMAKMGFKGGALGAAGNEGRTQPIELLIKDDRGGIGMDSEKKRKVREAAEAIEESRKKTKVSEEDYRERNRMEREERRAEGLWWGAMKVLEGIEEEEQQIDHTTNDSGGQDAARKSVRSINLLYRPLIKDCLEKEQERRARNEFIQSLSQNQVYHDPDEDKEVRQALGTEVEDPSDDEEDPELAAYEALPATQKLEKVTELLRHTYLYCFWCKYRYSDKEMEGCPGMTEDEHG